MATAQTSQSKSNKSRQPARERQSDARELGGERDEHYNVISVLYHGLQGADQCALYAEDAEEAGDDELAAFLRSAGEVQAGLARQAKQLLLERLSKSGGGRGARQTTASEEEEEEDED